MCHARARSLLALGLSDEILEAIPVEITAWRHSREQRLELGRRAIVAKSEPAANDDGGEN